MKQLIAVLFAATLCTAPARADQGEPERAAPKEGLTEQQKRVQQCSAEAKTKQLKAGREREAFISACLKGKAPVIQQKK